MKTVRIAGVLLLALAACQTSPTRMPVETAGVDPAFSETGPKDVVVLPVDASQLIRDETERAAFPEDAMRESSRKYLIAKKSYAVPTADWTDDTLEAEGRGALDTDAILEIKMRQWDTSLLGPRGVIYAGADFRLLTPDGRRELWHYTCRDRQIPIPGPWGESAAAANAEMAARRLAEDALSRLPHRD